MPEKLGIIFHWKFHDYGRFRVCPKRPCRINTFLTENIAKVKRVLPLFLPRIWQPENQGFGSTKKNTKPRPCFFPVHANMLPWPDRGGFGISPRGFFQPSSWDDPLSRLFFMAYGMTMASALQSRIPVYSGWKCRSRLGFSTKNGILVVTVILRG